MNDEFPPEYGMCGDKNELKLLCEEHKKLHGLIAIQQNLNKYHTQLILEQEDIKTKLSHS